MEKYRPIALSFESFLKNEMQLRGFTMHLSNQQGYKKRALDFGAFKSKVDAFQHGRRPLKQFHILERLCATRVAHSLSNSKSGLRNFSIFNISLRFRAQAIAGIDQLDITMSLWRRKSCFK
jgi:hypothetical protein